MQISTPGAHPGVKRRNKSSRVKLEDEDKLRGASREGAPSYPTSEFRRRAHVTMLVPAVAALSVSLLF